MSKKISLCMIVGNTAEYIERCLRSFAPIADEICMVRAIGTLEPDDTVPRAEKVAAELKIPFKFGEYRNKPDHDWPHVDDFAAARQASFDLATGDYCFWCDTDDVLKCGAEAIRRHADEGAYPAYIFMYEIFGKNVVVPRERMLLRGSGYWEFPVHECFQFKVKGTVCAQDDGVIVQHLPHLDKSGSNERNLKILESIPEDKMTVSLKYHLVGELAGAGRENDAVELAVKLLTEKDLPKDERYDLLMSLVIKTQNLQQRVDLLHEAHKVDPERREALGILATTMMDMGRPASAMAYARQMSATTEPQDGHCWNSRRTFYGYVGEDIYQQALRVNGRFSDANTLRKALLEKAGGPTIALLHATRGRPEMASRCRKNWHDLAAYPDRIEHIFAIDEDDKESQVLQRFHHVTVPTGGGCVRAWNVAAAITEAPILLQLSDDWIPVPMWDRIILDRIGDVSKPKVLAISDGARKDDLLCMAICTREYWQQDCFLFHPKFTGVYSDNWFSEIAYKRGAVIDAKDIVFTHMHPVFGKGKMDATYAAQNAPERYAQGKRTLEYLRAGKDWTSVPGFFNFSGFYDVVAEQLQDGDTVAEVGTWLGRSLIFLAQSLKARGKKVKIIAVDTFKGEANQPEHYDLVQKMGGSIKDAFLANLKRCEVEDMVQVIEGDSADSAAQVQDGSLAFCFIDAAHDYTSVKRDVRAWKPKVKAGGILGGHDADWPEVSKAVKEEVSDAEMFRCIWSARV